MVLFLDFELLLFGQDLCPLHYVVGLLGPCEFGLTQLE